MKHHRQKLRDLAFGEPSPVYFEVKIAGHLVPLCRKCGERTPHSIPRDWHPEDGLSCSSCGKAILVYSFE